MNEEELNEEELQEPDPSQGVAAPDFTLDQALFTKGKSLLGVGTSAIVRNIYTKISKIDGVQEMITKAQEQLPSISQKGVEEFKTQAAGRIQEIMRKLSESSFDVETLRNIIGKDQSGGLGGGGLPSDDDDDDEEEEEDIRGDATDEQIMQAYRERTGELQLNPTLNPNITTTPLSTPINFAAPTNITSSNPNFGGDGGFFKKVVQKAFRNKATFPSLFVDPVTLKPKRGFTNFEMASAYDRYIDNLAKKSGYKSLADFKVQVLDTLGPNDKMNLFRKLQDGENLRTGYIEHMIAKASKKGRLERIRKANPVLAEDEGYLAKELSRKSRDTYDMDWYWDETYIDKNGVTRPGLNKGNRDASRNVRINFNNRYKALKDVTEQVLYGTEANPGIGLLTSDLKNRLIVSIEDIDKRSFTFNRTQLGDVVIRRAGDNKLVGKLGNYLDVLYPQNNNAKSLLEQNAIQQINPNTGKKFTSLDDFREYMIRDRIEFIVKELPKLSRRSNRQRQRIIDEALAEDLAKLYEDYPFLPKPKYISEITDKGLDQNVIKPPVTESDAIQQELPDIKE